MRLPINKAPFAPCRTALKGFSLALGHIKKFIDVGREKGYLTYNEVNDLVPHDVHSPEDLDDLLTTVSTRGIDILEGQPELPALENRLEKEVKAGEDVELDLPRGPLEKTIDPARIYLREMGASLCSPAKRKWTLPSASSVESCRAEGAFAFAYCHPRDLAIGEDLKRGIRSIKEIVVFDEEEITEVILQNRVKDITHHINELQKHYKRASRLAGRLATIPAKKKAARIPPLPCASWAARWFGFRSSSATWV